MKQLEKCSGREFDSPESYEYIAAVKYMGDHTWLEVDNYQKQM